MVVNLNIYLFLVRSLERNGVSAIIMEDKIGLKKNSLFADQKDAKQDSAKNICKKSKELVLQESLKTFLIIARIESFILGKGSKDAFEKSRNLLKAGADAILIHSKEKNS